MPSPHSVWSARRSPRTGGRRSSFRTRRWVRRTRSSATNGSSEWARRTRWKSSSDLRPPDLVGGAFVDEPLVAIAAVDPAAIVGNRQPDAGMAERAFAAVAGHAPGRYDL